MPLERYISNFLLEVPAPVPGRMGVQLQMLDQSLDYPCPPPHEPLAWSGLRFEPVLEMVSPEALMAAFGCVLLEQQLLLHSSSLSLLTATAEFLTACLYPLAWCHVYIPVLPRHCTWCITCVCLLHYTAALHRT